MTRATRRSPPPDQTPQPDPHHARSAPAYLLVHTGRPELVISEPVQQVAAVGLCGPGWTLLACHGSSWAWSVHLDVHGVAIGAPAGTAQDVATRVLADQGVTVSAWYGGGSYSFSATVDHDTPVPHPRSPHDGQAEIDLRGHVLRRRRCHRRTQ